MADITTTKIFTAGEEDIDHSDLNQIIGGATIIDSAVTSSKLAADSVTTVKIQDKAVSLGKIQDVATGTFLGRQTADGGSLEQLTNAQAKAAIIAALADGDISLSKLPTLAQNSFLGRKTTGTGAVEALTEAETRTALGLGDTATKSIGTTSGTVAAGDDSRITGACQMSQSSLTYVDSSTAVDLAFSAGSKKTATISASDNLTLSTSGKAANSHFTVFITNTKAGSITITTPTFGKWYPSQLTTIAQGKEVVLTLCCTGTTDSSIKAAHAVSA